MLLFVECPLTFIHVSVCLILLFGLDINRRLRVHLLGYAV